jgi:tetratricopeptide (TPR) repeat protein
MTRRKRRINGWFVLTVLALIGMVVYVDVVIVPTTPPLFVPTLTPTRDPVTYADEARALFNEGKLNQAIDAYTQAVQADPKNASNYIELARLQVFAGRYQEALKNAQNAVLLNKNNSLANGVEGWALGQLGDYLQSSAAFARALAQDPNNALVHAYYAEVLALQIGAEQGEINTQDKAIEESRKAVGLDPNLFEVRRARGIVLEMTGNNQDAIAEFTAAAGLNDNIADIHLALGRNYLILDQYDKAVDEFIRANTLNPPDPLPDLYISRTYAKSGQYAKAVQYAEQAMKDSPSDPMLVGNLGSMYYRDNQFDQAVKYLSLAIRGGVSPEGKTIQGIPLSRDLRVLEYYYRFGLALAKVNQCNDAVQVAQAILQTMKDDETAVYNANAMIEICKENVTGTATPTLEATPPASAAKKTTPTPTAKP